MDISTTAGAWSATSAELTKFVRQLSSRRDVVVAVGAAGRAAPMGQFRRQSATIVLNSDRLFPAVQPGSFSLADPRVRAAHPTAMGILVHELGHAEHTWPRGRQLPETALWASNLEEPRIERLMLGRHPMARRWLRASGAAATLIGDLGSRRAAAEAAVLVIGRIYAGVFTDRNVNAVWDVLNDNFTANEIRALRQIICAAVSLGDNNISGMVLCAEALSRLIGEDIRSDGDAMVEHSDDDSEPGADTAPPQSDQAAVLLKKQLSTDGGASGATTDTFQRPRTARHPIGAVTGPVPMFTTTRNPTPDERRRATELAAALLAAAARPAAVETAAAATPPGHLSGPELVKRSVQRSRGAVRSATPWRTIRRRRGVPAALALVVIVDRSDSMGAHLAAASSVAWTLQQAITAAPGSCSRVVAFSSTASVIPNDQSGNVHIPSAGGGSNGLPDAVNLADQWFAASTCDRKLAVILTDGGLPNQQAVVSAFENLDRGGVATLWATPGTDRRLHGLPATIKSVRWTDDIEHLGSAVAAALSPAH